MQILVVEDDLPLRELLLRRLYTHGFEVDGASNGTAALETIVARPPELILMDLHLPDMSGIEVMRRLRAISHTRHLPVAILTSDDGAHEESLAAGCAAFLLKPFDLAELLAIIQRQGLRPARPSQ